MTAPTTGPRREKVLAYAPSRKNRLAVQGKGLVACFHPTQHPCVLEEQIDLFLENTDPALCGLAWTPRTRRSPDERGRGGEEVRFRINYMHLKDVDPDESVSPGGRWALSALGWGTVDSRRVKALRNGGYDGVLCVELDKQPVCNYHSAWCRARTCAMRWAFRRRINEYGESRRVGVGESAAST
jgi:inosose dehydratase